MSAETLVIRGPGDVLSGFSEYRKTALTRISDYAFPPGTVYQTPEGLKAEDEDTRCAVDVQGGVYPIRESVFRASYEPALAARPAPEPPRRHHCPECAWLAGDPSPAPAIDAHGHTCDLCSWGRDGLAETVAAYARHLRREHCR